MHGGLAAYADCRNHLALLGAAACFGVAVVADEDDVVHLVVGAAVVAADDAGALYGSDCDL